MYAIIFLDMDGVLVTDRCDYTHVFPDLDPPCVDALNDLVARSGAEVIISSTWRHAHPKYLDLYRFLGDQGVVAQIRGCTGEDRGHRAIEIMTWLAVNRPDGYVILDDMDVRPHNHLVRTTMARGLTPEGVERALNILKGV